MLIYYRQALKKVIRMCRGVGDREDKIGKYKLLRDCMRDRESELGECAGKSNGNLVARTLGAFVGGAAHRI